VIWSQNSRSNNCAVRDRISNVDWTGGQYSSGTDFIVDGSSLVELECENVFVISHCDDCLEHKNSSTSDYCVGSPIVGVLPENSVVYFMAANHVGDLDGSAVPSMRVCIEVFYMSKAVATKLEVVGIHTSSVVSKVKCRFSGTRSPAITVRHEHLRKCETVEERSSIICDIV
jgi:hypothetical protein